MNPKLKLNKDQILKLAEELNVDFNKIKKEQILEGYSVELEHSDKFGERYDVVQGNPKNVLLIALSHLENESPLYYLPYLKDAEEKMKKEASAQKTVSESPSPVRPYTKLNEIYITKSLKP